MLFSLGLRLEWMLGHVNNLLVLLNSEHKAGNLSLWNRIRFCLHHCRQWLKISSSFRKLILKLIKLNIIRPCRWTSSKRVVTVKLFPAFMRKSTEAKVLLSIFMEFDIQAAPFLVNFPSIHRDVSELSQLSITLHYWLHSNIEFPSFFRHSHATCCESHLAYWLSFRHCSSCLHCAMLWNERAKNSIRRELPMAIS